MFNYFKKRRALNADAKILYQGCVAQSRNPTFYAQYGVPDTIDGRFEMVALHCFLLMRRLRAAGRDDLSQKLFDVFFVTMDRTLREMGIGDLGVPKHMKRMMQGFNGRANAYEAALKSGNTDDVRVALIKNVYGTVDKPNGAGVTLLTRYMQECTKLSDLTATFAPVEMIEDKKSA